MVKNQRNYILQIQTRAGDNLEIRPPLSLEIDVSRKPYGTANTFSLNIYNLSEKNRDRIRKDANYDFFRSVTLYAGYGDKLVEVISGEVTECASRREGTNYITTVLGHDYNNAFVNGFTAQEFPAGTAQADVIKSLTKSLKAHGVELGAIGKFDGKLGRGNSYSGNTADILTQLTSGGFFIDNGVAHCLNPDECLEGEILTINSASGLLGTPTLQDTLVIVDMIFEPLAQVGMRAYLESTTNRRFNSTSEANLPVNQSEEDGLVGLYRINGIQHKGMISEVAGGTLRTTLTLQYGVFNPVAMGGPTDG